ncbi:Pyruvate, phosphate dikinase (Pyruvate, orthophosphate dikinase) [Acetoanaerobium sticklandii]|uniref:Pyruvate, phosphate dikinase n=1 Tax=Acetoanaerobium sticklandii (strain ATCC 12662 / DSM 519 / JCM 1433 / CCUG 9281 / NCIMB 10654 / HF) TaxID=499177 RepID=E3PSN3_ACESD|nr:pyruvate, phosphate dikinase [Acetoanaerobium sticklandii]CBH21887.1 Pyruvate, phosphate dikinase (Pyruvate, orthophosphate dikinase) [Acetoanaerobium sticklandii]
MDNKFVYSFHEGSKEMKSLLGGKGANLAEMTNIGLPVPPGFTITTKACINFYDEGKTLWPSLIDEIKLHLAEVEKTLNKRFSDEENPLLVSVRSGAVFSMPGMMDTILNLGLNDKAVKGLAKSTGNERFAYDSYRRFIQMFSDVAMEIPKVRFESLLEEMKENKGVHNDTDLNSEDLKALVEMYKKVYFEEKHEEFPQDPMKQLELAIKAVFESWNNPRAMIYRKLNDIPHDLGTAVNVQSMVFGNMGDKSGTGVAFTRNPADGENKLFGEFLINAQGEDVVAGIRTPNEISELKDIMPEVYSQFVDATKKLEHHYKDMQDIEFTIENERLFLLQTRAGKRTAHAAINVAVDLVDENLISKEEAIMRIEPNQLDQLLHPMFEPKALADAQIIAKGLPASPGAASGKIYFHADDVVAAKARGEKSILVRQETSPEDIEGMVAAEGILTARGGMTSHAAVVARGMGKCCVAGCSEIRVDETSKIIKVKNEIIKEGEFISLDGSAGTVYRGEIIKIQPELSGNFEKFMTWVDEFRRLKVRTNADTPKDAAQAVVFGAEGIGLCRTEHMFFDEKRIPAVRRMIVSTTLEERKKALDELLPMQRKDFYEIYEAMGERPVTVRLLDPPLHEFLPHGDEDIKSLAESMNIAFEDLKDRIEDLAEFNPMLGHRGCRLAVTYPEIYRMQTRAIIEAALDIKKSGMESILPEIMIPLIGDVVELKYVKKEIEEEIQLVFDERNDKVNYLIGTMIEVPRAAITADEIATEAEFFSFGTNDLTQMGYGFSRDDAGKFLSDYESKGIFEKSPFEVLDQKGIGKLMEIAVDLGKKTRANIKLGICGEHGGEPSSVEFCHRLGLDYVSCSPYRVPIARLAAAQAVIKESVNVTRDK